MAASKINAIETHYAGCRFRSRLEARWAVFFDALGIKWEYEPQGFELPSGRYLPDFRLAGVDRASNDNSMWVEVKGTLQPHEFVRLIRAVVEMERIGPSPLCPQMVVLGEIPRPGLGWTHARIEVSDDLWALRPVAFFSGEDPEIRAVDDCIPFRVSWLDKMEDETSISLCQWLTHETHMPRLMVDPDVDDAYWAARSARFEYGESG